MKPNESASQAQAELEQEPTGETHIHLNDYVNVRLSEYGKKVLDESVRPALGDQTDAYMANMQNEDGSYKLQLWSLMNTFGPIAYNGNPEMPFQEITFSESDRIVK